MEGEATFKNGHWIWDEEKVTLQFISHEVAAKESASVVGVAVQAHSKPQAITSIRFKESVDNLEKIQFRRHFQRHVGHNEVGVITVQDIKDVALFLANKKDLTPEFIMYFHLPEIDRFLKAIIAYFHYFLQLWDHMLERREEARRKLRQPIVTILEDEIRDDLSDIRSMVAREYCTIIMGIGKVAQFHHLAASTNSLSEKDRRLFEALLCMTVRVIWIALQRRHLQLIDLEVNQMFRTDYFNVIVHRNKPGKNLWRSPEEERVLLGTANIKETKLKQRSSPTKELIIGDHDYRMLGIGFKDFEPKSERSLYLERLFGAPDELLLSYGLTIGLIGIPRDHYDCMMMPRERTSKNFDQIVVEPIDIKLPPRDVILEKDMPKTYPNIPCMFHESMQTAIARKEQCSVWRKYVIKPVAKAADAASITSQPEEAAAEAADVA